MPEQLSIYFDTIPAKPSFKDKMQKKALTENEMIFSIFKDNPNAEYTPYEIQGRVACLYRKNMLITSVRRAITTLTGTLEQPGQLMKTSRTVQERAGSPNRTWTLRK